MWYSRRLMPVWSIKTLWVSWPAWRYYPRSGKQLIHSLKPHLRDTKCKALNEPTACEEGARPQGSILEPPCVWKFIVCMQRNKVTETQLSKVALQVSKMLHLEKFISLFNSEIHIEMKKEKIWKISRHKREENVHIVNNRAKMKLDWREKRGFKRAFGVTRPVLTDCHFTYNNDNSKTKR